MSVKFGYGPTAWEIDHRYHPNLSYGVGFAGTWFPGNPFGFDLYPGQGADGSGEGYTWLDCCDVNLKLNPNAPARTARIGITNTEAVISSRSWNGAAPLPMGFYIGTVPFLKVNTAGVLYPPVDAQGYLGVGSFRWLAVCAVNFLTTCDATRKDDVRDVDERAVQAVRKVKIRQFRHRDAPHLGWYVGPIAQELEQAFADEGLDINDFGLFHRDENGILSVDLVQFVLMNAGG